MWVSKREYAYLQGEIAFWRGKFEQERERGDRVSDALMAQLGQPAVTEYGVRTETKLRDEQKLADAQRTKELLEIYADTQEDIGLELPAELQDDAAQMIN